VKVAYAAAAAAIALAPTSVLAASWKAHAYWAINLEFC
jgi:hypothetical protein